MPQSLFFDSRSSFYFLFISFFFTACLKKPRKYSYQLSFSFVFNVEKLMII